jgi:hypothetical protein
VNLTRKNISFYLFGKTYKGEETDFSGKEEVCNSIEVLRPKFCKKIIFSKCGKGV